MQQQRKSPNQSLGSDNSRRPRKRSMSRFTIKCPKCAQLLELPKKPKKEFRARCSECGYEGNVPPDRVKETKVIATQPVRAANTVQPAESTNVNAKGGRGRMLLLLILIVGAGASWQFRDQLGSLVPSTDPTPVAGESSVASKAYGILEKHCADCHANGNEEGGFSVVLDAEQLVDGYFVNQGSSATSEVFARLSHTDQDLRMPPADSVDQMPTEEEIDVIRQWIDEGALTVAFSTPSVPEKKTSVPVKVSGSSDELALQAKQILQTACYRCHGESGRVEGGFNYVLNRDKLIAGGMIVPGDISAGKLLRRVNNESMPPRGESPRLTEQERAILEAWIEAGAPDFNQPLDRAFVTNREIYEQMEQDLLSRDEFDREYTRYFTLTHLYNAAVSDEEMETYRLALAKLLNSLSRQKDLFTPFPIDVGKTILRVDLRQLKWDQKTWRHIIAADPYAVRFNDASSCSSLTGCGVPSVRADWFVHKAAQPTLYHQILEIPDTLDGLLAEERVDLDRNIREAVAVRAGFNESGVSDNNRLIERHPSTYGAFWISYDFAGNKNLQNLMSHPLGPGDEKHHFKHDGGEVIFSLPNGLQAYMLVDAKGERLDQGPIDIVKDPKQSNAHVLNGVSCMSCHYAGIIPKNDEVGPTVRANPTAYTGFSDEIQRLYRDEQVSQFQRDDAQRFQDCLAQIGITEATKNGEPVFHMSQRFEISLDLKLAAAELGLAAADLDRQILARPSVGKVLGSLRLANGTIKRDRFLGQFANLAVALGIGTPYEGHETPVVEPDPQTPEPTTLPPGFRTWHDESGKKLFDAKAKSFDGANAVLELVDGTSKSIAVTGISDADLEELLRLPAPSASEDLPPLGSGDPVVSRGTGNGPPAQAFEQRMWMHRDGKEILQAVLVDLKDDEAYLVPGPREWTYKGGTPLYRTLHVIRFPKPGALGRGTLSIRLRDPQNGRVDNYSDLSYYSPADHEYIKSIETAVTSRRVEDLTDPNRGYLVRYGILWKVPLKDLSGQDQEAALQLHKLLPKDER